MKVPFVDYGKSYKKIKPEIDEAIQGCLERGDLILRKDVEAFEENLANFCGMKYAVGVNSGTDAILLTLMALNVPESEVITSGYTFWATIEAILWAKANPVIVDINQDLTINAKVIPITPKTKVIIPVHIGGKVCDMKAISDIAVKFGLFVIEDACQAIGAKDVGKYSDAVCFSFYPAKILGCYGDGGAVVTNNWRIAEKVRLLRHHFQKDGKPLGQGVNSRLDNIQAAVLNIKLMNLPDEIERRKEIAGIYNKKLKEEPVPENILPEHKFVLPTSEVWQEYNLRVYGARDKLAEFLDKEGIETIKGDYSFPTAKPLNDVLAANQQILRLPIWPDLTDEQIHYVIDKIKEFYGKK